MTNQDRYVLSIPTERLWGYFFCYGCEACPARVFCHQQPTGTCCKENYMKWANQEAAPSHEGAQK